MRLSYSAARSVCRFLSLQGFQDRAPTGSLVCLHSGRFRCPCLPSRCLSPRCPPPLFVCCLFSSSPVLTVFLVSHCSYRFLSSTFQVPAQWKVQELDSCRAVVNIEIDHSCKSLLGSSPPVPPLCPPRDSGFFSRFLYGALPRWTGQELFLKGNFRNIHN